MSVSKSIASKWKRLAVTVLIFVLLMMVFLENRREVEYFRQKFLNVSAEIEAVKQAHANFTEKNETVPSEAYEKLRRKMYAKTKDLWYFIKQHWSLRRSSLETDENQHNVLEGIRQKKTSLLSDMEQLQDKDGWHEWRQRQADEASDLVQRQLYQLQNPSDCYGAKKLTCAYSKTCDFGCRLHHIVYCISFAFAMNRTLILKSNQFTGWESMFSPLSDTCTSTFGDKVNELSSSIPESNSSHPWHLEATFNWQKPSSDGGKPITEYVLQYKRQSDSEWKTGSSVPGDQLSAVQGGLIPGLTYDFTVSAVNMAGQGDPSSVLTVHANYKDKIISLPLKTSRTQENFFLPLLVPEDMAQKAMRFNGDSASWWVGQVLKYILKPRPDLQSAIERIMTVMNFTTPTVGVHIYSEGMQAELYDIKVYMTQVEEYYDKLHLSHLVEVRSVYLVSEDPNMLDDARKSYPSYQFFGLPKTFEKARRWDDVQSLATQIVDLHMLAKCDYIVCSFNSQIGRIAYEMMQANRVDASNSFYSLDNIYYFGKEQL